MAVLGIPTTRLSRFAAGSWTGENVMREKHAGRARFLTRVASAISGWEVPVFRGEARDFTEGRGAGWADTVIRAALPRKRLA